MNEKSLLELMDFGNEAGDDEKPEVLNTYFVEQALFKEFLDPKKNILIATAKKGVGKSALLNWLGYHVQLIDASALVIRCTGADLSRNQFRLTHELKTPNDHIRDWMTRICALINRKLASNLDIALTDDQITLVESAELDGYKSRNLISCLTDRFTKILNDKQPTKIHAKNEVELLRRVQNRVVWFIVDDLDATFQNTPEECLSISTFFSACRYLATNMKGICFRVTMRTDVWPTVRRYDESLDKVQQYLHDITWEQSDFRALLSKRISSQIESLKMPMPALSSCQNIESYDEKLISKIFEPKMIWGDFPRYTYRVIYTLSYYRPRWAIQLCKRAQARANKLGDKVINKSHIDSVWGDYGRLRIHDLTAEHKHQCKDIVELINAFRGAERKMKRDELILWIKNRISQHITPVIEGKEAKSPLEIAHFLYRIGFIVARSDNSDGTYEHHHYDKMPDLLETRTNDDFGMAWEIHPCFREALDIIKLNAAQRQNRMENK